ncbi:MAG TPA: acyltransferase [Candidatus Dormibacteraeota bacterium]|nr:acyltransferase [Candidatus Dormibacteraeota bacterium]
MSSEATVKRRVNYLDWLRVLAVLGVFFYHSLQPFSEHDWHVKNAQLSGSVDAVVSFVDPWGVAFFFLVAGASGFLALRSRTAGQYIAERLQRLLLPLVVAYLLLSPLQAFIEERHFGRYTGSFIAGIPLFFQNVASALPTTITHPLLVDRTYHLWFVVFLLWFALLGLPLFLWLRAPQGQRLIARFATTARWRGATLLFAIPLMVLPLAVLPLAPDSEDWGTFVYLFGFFVAGYVLMSDARLIEAVRRDAIWALVFAIAVDAAILLAGVPQNIAAWQGAPSYSWTYVWSYLLVGVQAWAWVLFFLGVGMRARPFARPLPTSISAAAMPFFIVHQPVILAIAFFVVRWDIGMPSKWAVIAVSALLVSALLATALSRLPLVSTLFGVKRRGGRTSGIRTQSLIYANRLR